MRHGKGRLTALVMGLLALSACTDRESMTSPTLNPELSGGEAGTQNTYSGEATVVRAVVPLTGTNLTLIKAGPIPSSGGAAENKLLSANVPGLVSATVLHATAVGQGQASRAEASVADVNLTVAGNTIGASLLMARANASCSNGNVALSGKSHLAQLVINGKTITVSGYPNQTVYLPVGKVIINEQSRTANSITVNALHVIIPGVADVIVSSAHADITCARVVHPCPPAQGDFVTGGGWIVWNGSKANFGVAGGIKQQGLWGHLTYHDKGSNLKVKGTGVTGYVVVSATTRKITGTAEINGAAGTYEVWVTDNGEPGSNDFFKIKLSTGYTAYGTLGGGNIQLHQKPTSTECP
ncbi:MAG TPA: choice-of-anchor P family protein [Gemmatimonadales bacterium]|jgi:hypothetical protein|nr:choice-of-anchor P family protein [Gemmatimonadales bacterium]